MKNIKKYEEFNYSSEYDRLSKIDPDWESKIETDKEKRISDFKKEHGLGENEPIELESGEKGHIMDYNPANGILILKLN